MLKEMLPKTADERLWRLAEECFEVAHVCAKIGRFGPKGERGWNWDNVGILRTELEDLKHAIEDIQQDLGE